MISSGSSAVSNRPLKKSSAAIRRLLVMIVAPRPEHGRRIVGVRIVVGERAADRAAMAHRRIADHAGELGQRRQRLLDRLRVRHLDVARRCAPITIERPFTSMPREPSIRPMIDERGRLRQPQLHRRQQRMAAGQELGLRSLASRLTACRTEVGR